MLPYIAEFSGTVTLTILGDNAVANVTSNKSGMKGAGSIQITLTWGFVVVLPAFIFGAASGAHFNPALTIALAVDRSMTWGLTLGCIVAQPAGAFVDTVIVYLPFKDRYDTTKSTATKLGTFYTGPSVPNMGRNILSEAVGTFVLVLVVKGIDQITGITPGIDKLLVLRIIVSIGMSLGGLIGYAVNPARDLGPRLAHAVLSIKDKGDFNWGYASVVITGPVVDAVVVVLLYQAIPRMQHVVWAEY